jgi:hypothetical protein
MIAAPTGVDAVENLTVQLKESVAVSFASTPGVCPTTARFPPPSAPPLSSAAAAWLSPMLGDDITTVALYVLPFPSTSITLKTGP